MPRTYAMPSFLDEHGQHLWQAFMTSREHASAARLELKRATPAMRRTSQPGGSHDPAIIEQYQAARQTADEAERARRTAEREYHAYRRVLLVRSLQSKHHAQFAARPMVSGD